MAGALTHDPITPGGGLHQTPSGGVQTSSDGLVRALAVSQAAAVAVLADPVGTVTAAALAATTGTPGQTIRIADGADAGAALVWAIPAGASTYTWCWWLWPQAAY